MLNIALTLLVMPALPDVRVHFQPTFIDGGCWVDDQRPFGAGDPDRFYRLAIFDESSGTVFNACANGCGDDGNENTIDGVVADHCGQNTGCGGWDIPDPEISKILGRNQGAWIYFGYWDDDFDANDSLGDHWVYATSFLSVAENNNNLSPYYADTPIDTVCGSDVEGIGDRGNFALTYTVWFSDNDGPIFSGPPVSIDNGGPSTTDDDDTLEFQWPAAIDEDSGISGYVVTLYDVTWSATIFADQPVSGNSVTIGPFGDLAFTPVVDHTYRFWVGARNGGLPQLTDKFGLSTETLVWSGPIEVLTTPVLPVEYCSTSPNSANAVGSQIGYTGTSSIFFNNFDITASGAPPGQPGLFYYGPNQIQTPFGEGFRCVGGTVTRLSPSVVISSPGGVAAFDLNNTLAPHSANLQPGTNWNFQFWFRDPAAGGSNFNLSNALSVPFQP